MSLGNLAKKCNLERCSGTDMEIQLRNATNPYENKLTMNFTLATCWLAGWLAGWFKKVDNSL